MRLRPLFSVGIHDIPYLEKQSIPSASQSNGNGNGITHEDEPEYSESRVEGWIACTTDEILAMKPQLYDIVVEMPSSHIGQQGNKRPIIKTADGRTHIKATQRDLRRWRMLKRVLGPLKTPANRRSADNIATNEEDEPLMQQSTSTLLPAEQDDNDEDSEAVEPTTWSELAYSSFYWWASAGEKDEIVLEEENQDGALFSDLVDVAEHIIDERRYRDSDDVEREELNDRTQNNSSPDSEDTATDRQDARIEMALISYFHKITRKLFDVCSDVLEDDADDDEGSVSGGLPNIKREELRQMGLDGWSKSDREFVRAFFELWHEREVEVDRMGIECCGLRIC